MEKPLEQIMDLEDFLNDTPTDYWNALRDTFLHSEGITQNKRIWLNLFTGLHPGRENLMSKQEHKIFNSLPEEIPIFRGCAENLVNGISWTTDHTKALWFANRFQLGKPCVVVSGFVKKKHVLAFFNDRKENEIVVDPKHVKRKTKVLVPSK